MALGFPSTYVHLLPDNAFSGCYIAMHVDQAWTREDAMMPWPHWTDVDCFFLPDSGSAGLINMIQLFTGHHIVAGVLCVFATALWFVQGFGHLFYYR